MNYCVVETKKVVKLDIPGRPRTNTQHCYSTKDKRAMTINVTLVPPRRVEIAELDCVGDGVDADVVLVLVALNLALFTNAVKFAGELSTALIALLFHISD
jgi:hypothetical protein